MGKRFTDTEKFKDPWYRKLKPKHKCLWEFLLAECNHAGIIKLDLELASFLIKEEITEDDLKLFEGKIQHLEKDLYFIPNFIKFQYGKLSKLSKPHIPVIKILESYNIPFELIDEEDLDNSQMRQRITQKTRQKIFIRDKFECQYCGSKDDLEIDHIVPLALGGNNEDDNLITVCHRCNHAKRDLPLSEFIKENKENIKFLDRVSKILDTLQEKEKDKDKKDITCNLNFENCFKIYQENCKNLLPLCFERKSKAVLDELNQFLQEIDYDFEYFLNLCKKANNLKKIVDSKIDFRSMVKNHIGITNGKYIQKPPNKPQPRGMNYSSDVDPIKHNEEIRQTASEMPGSFKKLKYQLQRIGIKEKGDCINGYTRGEGA